jgi:hypothetical protein
MTLTRGELLMRARRHRKSYWLWILALVALALPAQPIITASAQAPAATKAVTRKAPTVATTSSVTLQVRSSRDSLAYSASNPTAAQKLDPIPDLRKTASGADLKPNAPKDYHWLVNLDNTGSSGAGTDDPLCHPSTNPSYPQGCAWPSIRYAVASPVLTEGTWADWNTSLPLPTYANDPTAGVSGLPDSCDPTSGNPVPHAAGMTTTPAGTVPCRYLVSVTANGYQIGGAHFTVPMAVPGVVNVFLNPEPIPLGTMRLRAFSDTKPTDGTFDELTESGLVGFLAVIFDVDGILQADYFGNPLCTIYKTDPKSGKIILDSYGKPTPLPAKAPAPPDPKTGYYNPTVPGRCQSDTNGDLVIPNLAPNHYSARVTPPDFDPAAPLSNNAAYHWLQTTTLEGNHDHDVWVQPDDTGLDSERVVGGESVPFVDFGFVPATPQPASWVCPAGGVPGQTPGCGQIKGQLWGGIPYVPGINGLPGLNGANGQSGLKLDKPIDRGWIALNNLNSSTGDTDTMVATIPADKNGYFSFNNVPDGDYSATLWDEPQDYSLDNFAITINHGAVVDIGVIPLLGWFAHISGHVFIDTNGNGRMDPGEQGLFHAFVQNLNRTNNTMVGGIPAVYTDNNGFYDFTEAYPLGLMSINQFFNTRFKTTGVTWQACNDPKEHTVVAPMVDVSYLPIIGQCGRLDWAVIPYNPSANGDNGGVVATMIYDQTRQKFNARQAQTGDFQTGIPGFRFEQYSPVKAAAGATNVDPMSGYALNPDGSYQTTAPLTTPDGKDCSSLAAGGPLCYVSENNAPPAKCYPQDANGNPLGFDPTNPQSLDFMIARGGACIETSASGTQFGLGTDNGTHPVQTVDGNYTLGNGSTIPAMNLGDVLVRAVVPVDNVLGPCPIVVNATSPLPPGCDAAQAGLPRKLYTYTKEEDVNLFSGAQYVPQGANMASLPWPPKANYFAGTMATGVTATTLTDSTVAADPTRRWTPDAFVGDIVSMGTVTATVTSNTDSTVTFTNGWSGPTPTPGPYTIRFQSITPGNYDENTHTYAPGIDPICAGMTHTVQVTNPDLLANGGSPLEGQVRHSCDMKLLNIQAGQSIAPNFHVHTAVDVPLPAHFWGYIVDDVSVETNRKSTNIGEVHGIPGVPIGVYDWTGRRTYTAASDYNGVWEVLMPSEDINNCPVPAGTCPNVYRFVGNDPGQPGSPNLNHDPNYRTITANFEAWPNMLIPADTAPTRVVPSIEGPGVQFTATDPCGVPSAEPQLFAVDPAPYTRATSMTLTIHGANFGTSGHVEFAPANGDTPLTLRQVGAWTDHQVQVTIGRNATDVHNHGIPTGPGMLTVVSGAIDPNTGKAYRSTSGVTFHVIGSGYQPNIIEVGPGKQFDPFAVDGTGKLLHPFAIQDALELAASQWQAYGVAQVKAGRSVASVANDPHERYLVVVYPKWDPTGAMNPAFVPLGTYFENLLVHSPVKLQGVGPGGSYADPITGEAVAIQGSIIDGSYFNTVASGTDTPAPGAPTDPAPDLNEPALLHWVNLLDAIEVSPTGTGFLPTAEDSATNPPWSGQQDPLGEGAVVTVLGTTGTYPTRGYSAAVDGFTVTGGDQNDFPGNISEISGQKTAALPETTAGGEGAGAVNTQGGAVYLNGGTDHYQITNNLVRQNSGSYGTIRLGTIFHGDARSAGGASHNYDVAISHNQVAFNGGTNLAGAVGIFSDSNRYSVDHNSFCMNASMEYGGAISHFGYSPNGKISSNKIFLNMAFDEGGAIMVAGEGAFRIVPGTDGNTAVPDPQGMTEGSGPVSIDHNYIAVNLAQDDGGALRIMGTTGTKSISPVTVTDNIFNNNISSHEGGAISINDAALVNIVNDTFAGNLTTATATTSNGAPAPAGVSSGLNSAGLNSMLAAKYGGSVPSWMGTNTWPGYSNALIQNDIFQDNRAGSWTPNGVAGIAMAGDTTPINHWDVGSPDAGASLTVRNSMLNSLPNAPSQTFVDGGGNLFNQDPQFVAPYNIVIQVVQQRTYFRFRPSAIVSVDLPANTIGNYHLANVGSPAHGLGVQPTDLQGGIRTCAGQAQDRVLDDIDCAARPAGRITAGAHEVTTAAPAPPAGAAPAAAAPSNPPLTPAARAGGVGGANLALNLPAPAMRPVAAKAQSANAGAGNAAGSSTAAGFGTARAAPSTSASAMSPLSALLAFESQPVNQGETGAAGLVLLSIILAALWYRQRARRRQQPVSGQSIEHNIEGGEQL